MNKLSITDITSTQLGLSLAVVEESTAVDSSTDYLITRFGSGHVAIEFLPNVMSTVGNLHDLLLAFKGGLASLTKIQGDSMEECLGLLTKKYLDQVRPKKQ